MENHEASGQLLRGRFSRLLGGELHDLLKEKRVLSKVTLVHGLVDGQGPPKGTRYGHAWVEANGMASDFFKREEIYVPGSCVPPSR